MTQKDLNDIVHIYRMGLNHIDYEFSEERLKDINDAFCEGLKILRERIKNEQKNK